jgi:uncharacterized protein with PIN domain
VRFYANENFPLVTVRALRAMGHDVLTVQDAGNAGRAVPDDEVLSFAVAEGRVLLTLNRRDFIRLARSRAHAGIIVCTQDPDTLGQAARIDAAVRGAAAVDGVLLRVNRADRA